MASVFDRGTRDNPKFVAKYDSGERTVEGAIVWRQKVAPPEITSKTDAKAWAAQFERDHKDGKAPAPRRTSATCGALMDAWEKTLDNRSADADRSRLRQHMRPAFATRSIDSVDVSDVLAWIDTQRSARDRLSEGSIGHNVRLLSRFYSWCIQRKYATVNPVRSVPPNSRPSRAPKKDVPYLNDNRKVRAIYNALPEPIGLMFYIGHTSGLRLGEICGLRIADVALFLNDGMIRSSHSYDGPLKEDKRAEGKSKMVPAAADAKTTIRPWLNRRLAAGAEPNDYFFPNRMKPRGKVDPSRPPPPGYYQQEYVDNVWNQTLVTLGYTKPGDSIQRRGRKAKVDKKTGAPLPIAFLSFYEATRHSFASRLLEAGNSLDEVSHALNHSSPEVTKRHYAHWERKSYSPTMRIGVGVKAAKKGGGKVVAMQKKQHRHGAAHGARVDIGGSAKNGDLGK